MDLFYSYPWLSYFRNGAKVEDYTGVRTLAELEDYVGLMRVHPLLFIGAMPPYKLCALLNIFIKITHYFVRAPEGRQIP